MFPYIQQIKVNDCFTYKNFTILNELPETLKHIIITGKNGSGKTTILNRIYSLIGSCFYETPFRQIHALKNKINSYPNDKLIDHWKAELKKIADIELRFFKHNESNLSELAYDYLKRNVGEYIFSFFQAHRKVLLSDVHTVTKEADFINQLDDPNKKEQFVSSLKQYLVNKKVYEAFDYMDSNTETQNQNNIFFQELTETLIKVLNDKKLSLKFEKENFEFYIKMGDGRKITLNQLSDGFSAFMSILLELFIRTDIIRKQRKNFAFNPEGIILIDEPETHFHIEMQYEILPLLNNLFPNVQLVVATHSPAIISSLKNAVVFDLSTKKEIFRGIASSSFSDLMITHFGLENEFSPIADKIIEDFKKAYTEKNEEKMMTLMEEYEEYLTPSLNLEIEFRIAELKGQE